MDYLPMSFYVDRNGVIVEETAGLGGKDEIEAHIKKTIASGAAHFDLFTFVWASIVTRGLRFFLVAALLWKFGEPIRAFIEKRLTLVMWLFLIALVGGFVAVKFLFK